MNDSVKADLDPLKVLPCDVIVQPATVIRKGCTLRTLLLALEQREKLIAGGQLVPDWPNKSLAARLPDPAPAEGSRLEERVQRFEEALWSIDQWSQAYPEPVFPEPDDAYFAKAHEVLVANGMTLDRLSAHAMRHVVRGVGEIARNALGAATAGTEREGVERDEAQG